MQTFQVDDELASLIERLARVKPFESLTFNDALWRVMRNNVKASVHEEVIENLSEALEEARSSGTTGANLAVDDDLLREMLMKQPLPSRLVLPKLGQKVSVSLGSLPQNSTSTDELEQLLAEAKAEAALRRRGAFVKKAPTPSASDWAASVQELKSRKGLTTWQAVCDVLKIDTAGDSARRKLKNWVKANRPNWPPVPDA